MALRLRRGTDAERLLITPVEGELIYTTDTKLLYAGDGTTAGGNVVTGAGGGGSTTLDALTDTDLTGASDNDVLTYNSGTNKWESVAVPGVGVLSLNDLSDVFIPGTPSSNDILRFDGLNFTAHPISQIFNEQQNYKINIVSDDSTIMVNTDNSNITGNFFGDVTGNVTGNLSGTVDGDINGSVFGDDSTLIIDGQNNTISTIAILASQVNTNLLNRISDVEPIVIQSDNRTPLVIKAVTDGSLGGFPYTEYQSVKGSVDAPQTLVGGDVVGGWKITGYDSVSEDGKVSALWVSAFAADAVVTDSYPKSTGQLLISKGGNSYNQFMFGSEGEFKAPGAITPGVFADSAARDAGITTPTAGMMVFVTDVSKFQGYNGTAWTDLN